MNNETTGSPSPLRQTVIPVQADTNSYFELLCVQPAAPSTQVVYWLPAMGVPARHYLPLAESLAEQGIAVVLHEWRGIGSSNHRAGRHDDWGYRELLDDLEAGWLAWRRQWPQARCWLGGHSLGGQFAAMFSSLHRTEVAGLLMVASGAPYWRGYRYGSLLHGAFTLAPWLAGMVGYLPGRRIGFGGNEARGVIADWARSGHTGRYAAKGLEVDLEQSMAATRLPVLALRLRDDWLGPQTSLDWLLGKMPDASRTIQVIAPEDMDGLPAGHFEWMKAPAAVANRIVEWMTTH